MVEALLDHKKKEDTRICQIRGEPFQGLSPLVKDPTSTAKVLMVHGVGNHIPGYSTQLMENLSNEMALSYLSKIAKNIALTDPLDSTKKLGNLRINRLTNEDKSHELLFYELTWSEITAGQKEILAYDNSGEYSFRRAAVNDLLKKFTNDTGPDPMIYLGDSREDILIAFSQSFCWMVSAQWDDLPVTSNQACIPSDEAIDNMLNKDHYAFVSHSLGSRITIDGLQRIAALFGDQHERFRGHLDRPVKLLQAFQKQRIPIFMLSNQLPMLQLGRKLPEVTGQWSAYCRADGEHYNSRLLSETSIIAFSDPNDILSYAIPHGFIDQYIDSRLCVDTTNININVAKIINAFGVDMANPLKAHIAYETDERIIALMANGVGNENTSPIINERCQTLVTSD
jgi:hypothetical protein